MLGERAAHGQPSTQFGTVKNSPGLHDLTKMCLCVICMKLLEMNGLNCVENDILMHAKLMCQHEVELYKNITVCEPLELDF